MNPLKGPRVQTTRVNTVDSMMNESYASGFSSLDRGTLAWHVQGEQYGGDRQLFDVLGYQDRLRPEHYIAKYERGPGIAKGLIDKPIHDSWAGDIEITESEDVEQEETPFEVEARRFLNGDYTRLSPLARFRAADRWARALEFSLILIGVNDDNVEEGRAGTLDNPVDEASVESLEDINYLAVYKQTQVNWEETELVEDPTDPRYRLPETYNVDVSSDTSVDIHHSRIIHVVEEPDENELRSPSIYKPIFNRLDDVQKLLGGSAEMFWRAAYPGLVLTPPTDADGVPMKFDDDGTSVADQIEEYRMNLNRLHRVTGNLEKLDTDVARPDHQINVQMQDISAAIDIPMSIIRGNETGERATEQDRAMYHEYIGRRQREHCEQQILRKIFDRILDWGALPSTESGNETSNSYNIEFPPKEEPTEKERAETANEWAQAFQRMSGGSPNMLATAAERRKLMDMDPEYGSEAPDIDPEDMAAENLMVPPEEDMAENMPQQNPDGDEEES